MKRKFIFFWIFINYFSHIITAQKTPHILTFFIKPIPLSMEKLIQEELKAAAAKKKKDAPPKEITDFSDATPKISQPRKVLKELFGQHKDINLQTGIYASYAGSTTFSDINGQIKFNRKSPGATIWLLVTRDIKPVPIHPDKRYTISGFVINPKAPAKLFSFKKEKDPKDPKKFYWIVSENPVNKNKRIPHDTIILFSKPKYIVVNLGKFETIPGENFLLPDIYTRKNPGFILSPILFLKIRHFFAPIKTKYEFKPPVIQEQII